MRQHGDLEYANLLSNVRHGSTNNAEYALLETRRISSDGRASTEEVVKVYQDLTCQQLSPIILMPRTEQCRQVNESLLNQLDSGVVQLPAIDTRDTVVEDKLIPNVEAAYRKVDEDITRTAGLDKCIWLSIGAKVMLKRNISVEAGLVNGAVGTITGFGTKQTGNGAQITSVDSLTYSFRPYLSQSTLKDSPALLKYLNLYSTQGNNFHLFWPLPSQYTKVKASACILR